MHFNAGLFLTAFFAVSVRAAPLLNEEVLLLKTFADADSVFVTKLPVVSALVKGSGESAHPSCKDSIIICYHMFSHRHLIGYGLAASVQSKSSMLRVLLALDTSGSVVGLELPGTHDPRSARLLSRIWRKQFLGKNDGTLGHIDALSGATISSNDVEKTVRMLLSAFAMTHFRTEAMLRLGKNNRTAHIPATINP